MRWTVREAAPGDMIRIQVGSIWHYGIFLSEAEVIQFGPPPTQWVGTDPADISVIATDIDTFRQGGFPEVGVLSLKERLARRSPARTMAAARSRLGETGYDFLSNNCEHFAYDCMFGKPYCSQTVAWQQFLSRLPGADCYYLTFPQDGPVGRLGFAPRDEEIAAVRNEAVKREKYWAWKLLEYAFQASFQVALTDLAPVRGEDRKWRCNGYGFSISHSGNVAAVAVSRQDVGIDVECRRSHSLDERLAKRILSERELAAWQALSLERQPEELWKRWTQKESMFKRQGGVCFDPRAYDADAPGAACQTRRLTENGVDFYLSAALGGPGILRLNRVRAGASGEVLPGEGRR